MSHVLDKLAADIRACKTDIDVSIVTFAFEQEYEVEKRSERNFEMQNTMGWQAQMKRENEELRLLLSAHGVSVDD